MGGGSLVGRPDGAWPSGLFLVHSEPLPYLLHPSLGQASSQKQGFSHATAGIHQLPSGLRRCAGASAAVLEPRGDEVSIVAALAQAQSGDTVQLPSDTIELTEPLRMRSRVTLLGRGQDKTQLVYAGSKPGVLIALNDCEDVEIAQLTIDGRDNPLVHQGISGGNSRRLWLHHLTIRNLKAKTWGPHGILFSGHNPSLERGVTDSRITDCRLENIGLEAEYGGGIRLAWGSDRNEVADNVVHNTGRGGIFGDHSAELVIRKNRVSGSGGVGLGIEIWGGCPRSLIEDNMVDHWLSVDRGHQSAVRRNTVGTSDGTLKGYGIEIIARDVVVTGNVITRGAHIGLSVSNQPVKNNVFWADNTIRDCLQWDAQLQGETGGIAHHYFYRCAFEKAVRGDPRARYPNDSGHGFRTNGNCRGLVFEECLFRDNGGLGVQLGGSDIDAVDFRGCEITGNGLDAVRAPTSYTLLEFSQCQVQRNARDQLPEARPFPAAPPVANFQSADVVRAGQPVRFRCTSQAAGVKIVDRLWDFGQGIPETSAEPTTLFKQPGKYRVTLVVWDSVGRGGRSEQTIEVMP